MAKVGAVIGIEVNFIKMQDVKNNETWANGKGCAEPRHHRK
jgi:hypothetical protein